MQNREIIGQEKHERPCYYAFQDKDTSIYWVIPISSQVSKYEKIYNKKISKLGRCDTIHFGYVIGEKRAFLIQNMCPIIDQYINNIYIDLATKNPVVIDKKLADEIVRKARLVLKLEKMEKKIIFPDVLRIEAQLQSKLSL